ncbi:MAG TPA: HPF/RaiA family ribosome-associated protein [Polyangia bacterium]
MHVYLAARHVALSDEIHAYVEAHLLKPIREHNGLEVIRTEVQLFAEGPHGGCHVLVEVKGHHDVNVRELQDNLRAAVDVARDRVIRQLGELRDKVVLRRRHPRRFSLARLGRALGWLEDNRTRA